MAHLGDNVAAFVDGQLSPEAASAVESHLDGCDTCRHAVRQQRLLKSRMRGVGHPEPSPHLVASLNTLSQSPPQRRPWWSRVLGSASIGVGFVLLGASIAVVAVAYMVGPADASADEVSPPFDRFAAEYSGFGQRPSGSLTASTMDELDEYGWPCHALIGDGLERVAGHWRNRQETVALVYSDGINALNLFEQSGSLDPRAVESFEQQRVADRQVWVREGRPRIVTWHAAGVVYTIVTELGDSPLGAALADLPRPDGQPDPVERVGDGLTRMTTWVSAS